MEISAIARSLFDLFFPHRCVGCDAVVVTNSILCVNCSSQLPLTNWDFGDENLSYQKLKPLCRIQNAYSLLYFHQENLTQKLLHSLKYHNRTEIGQNIADLLVNRIEIKNFDGLIPIPIHPKKLKKRGYNQVESFANRLSYHTGIPLMHTYLVRKENNPSQVHKNREKRLNSIQHAFAINHEINAGHYILLDDVLTTGATLAQCANLLVSEPDVKISVITMACAT